MKRRQNGDQRGKTLLYPSMKKLTKNDCNIKQLSTLQEVVEKSKMGIENMSNFQKDEKQFSQKLLKLQQELQTVILQITTESKKNKIFTELIEILKIQMSEIEHFQTEEIEKQEGEITKKIKELKIEIDRICQKRNQQVANIRDLRELASAARGQRVIYSNLFKKIQKQIKQMEESYQTEILEVQKAKKDLQITKICSIQSQKLKEKQMNTESEETGDIKFLDDIFSEDKNFNHQEQILSMKADNSYRAQKVKNSMRVKEKKTEMSCYSKRSTTENIVEKIEKLERFCEEVKARTGYQHLGEILQKFGEIQRKNEEVFQEIDKMDSEIEETQKQIETLEDNHRNSKDFTEKYVHKLEETHQKSVPLRNTIHEQVFTNILQVFRVNKNENKLHLKYESILIDKILQQAEMIVINHNDLNRLEKISQADLDVVFQKMDVFHQCEKIMDKEMFISEYSKQIVKKGKIRSKKP